MSKRSRIVHVEWRSRDVERLKQFYKNAFRWKFEDPMPGYALADMGSKEARGGFMQLDSGSPLQPGIVTFLGATDLGAAEAAIRDAGGQVIASAQPVEGWGRFTVFADPDGNQLALWQSEEAWKKIQKQDKKAEKKRLAAEREQKKAEKKAKKKAEKKAQKQARKAEQGQPVAVAPFDGVTDKKKGKKADKKKDKKAKKKAEGGAEVSP